MRSSPASQLGFTLIEVLVALALMAMIGTILITSLQIGGHTWQRATHTAGNTEDIAQAQDFIRRHLSTLYPDESVANRATQGFLVSDGTALEFLSAAPESSRDGLWLYRIEVSRETGALQVKSRPDYRGAVDTGSSQWTSETLLPQAESLTVQFWLTSVDQPGRWVDRWTDRHRPPALIRVDVSFARSDHRRWPSLYVEPRIDTPTSCVFDVVSRRCRSST
jgi:general secretion pathway protein J